MYKQLAELKLKDKQRAAVGVVVGTDEDWAGTLTGFYAHKPRLWVRQINTHLTEDCSPLEPRVYICHRGKEVLSGICTYEHGGVGAFEHVYTDPEWRRKGAAKAIMSDLVEDFNSRGGRALYLGTGHGSVAYNIYGSFGFANLHGIGGFMGYFGPKGSVEDFEKSQFAQGKTEVRDVNWGDWPGVIALGSYDGEPFMRSALHGIVGARNWSGVFLELLFAAQDRASTSVKVMVVAERSAVVGIAALGPDPRFGGHVRVFDVFVHPGFAKGAGDLISAFDFSGERGGKVQCYTEGIPSSIVPSLKAAGFEQEADFSGQIVREGRKIDVQVLARE